MHLCTLLLIKRGPLLYHFSLLLGPCGYQRCNGRNQQNLKSTYSLRILIQHWHCMNSLAVMIASRCSRYICLSANLGVSSPAVTYSTVTCGVPGSSSGTDHAFYHREYPISAVRAIDIHRHQVYFVHSVLEFDPFTREVPCACQGSGCQLPHAQLRYLPSSLRNRIDSDLCPRSKSRTTSRCTQFCSVTTSFRCLRWGRVFVMRSAPMVAR